MYYNIYWCIIIRGANIIVMLHYYYYFNFKFILAY